MKKTKFNECYEKIMETINENNMAGGAMSVFGDVSATQSAFSGDTYASDNATVPKLLSKKVIRRNQPELSVFATGVSKKRKSKNGKQKQNKR